MEAPKYLKQEIAGYTACGLTMLSLAVNISFPCALWYVAVAF